MSREVKKLEHEDAVNDVENIAMNEAATHESQETDKLSRTSRSKKTVETSKTSSLSKEKKPRRSQSQSKKRQSQDIAQESDITNEQTITDQPMSTTVAEENITENITEEHDMLEEKNEEKSSSQATQKSTRRKNSAAKTRAKKKETADESAENQEMSEKEENKKTESKKTKSAKKLRKSSNANNSQDEAALDSTSDSDFSGEDVAISDSLDDTLEKPRKTKARKSKTSSSKASEKKSAKAVSEELVEEKDDLDQSDIEPDEAHLEHSMMEEDEDLPFDIDDTIDTLEHDFSDDSPEDDMEDEDLHAHEKDLEENDDEVPQQDLPQAEGAFVVRDAEEEDETYVPTSGNNKKKVIATGATADPVKDYLKQIGRVNLLNAKQEVDLSERIEAGLYAQHLLDTQPMPTDLQGEEYKKAFIRNRELRWAAADGRKAKDHLLEANLRLVVSLAKRYTGRGMLFLDLIQEGNLGLIRAVEKFDWTKGFKFSTYATWWIRQAITRAMADQARTIRVPVHMVEVINKLSRVQRQMLQDLGREPTPDELARELDMSVEKVQEVQKYGREPISLHTPLGEDGDSEFGDLIEDTDAIAPSEAVAFSLLQEQFKQVLETLSSREAGVIKMRYGLEDGQPKTLDEIGTTYGVTRERIRQIESKTMSKLRHPSRSQALHDFLEQ